MLAAPFTDGVTIYAFYAMQPYLLALYGNEQAYGIAGLAAAIVGGAQIAGGLLVPYVSRHFRRRTSILFAGTVLSTVILLLIGLIPHFWVVHDPFHFVGLDVLRCHAGAQGISERADSFRGHAQRFCRSTPFSGRAAESAFSLCSARLPTYGAIRSPTSAARRSRRWPFLSSCFPAGSGRRPIHYRLSCEEYPYNVFPLEIRGISITFQLLNAL